MKKTQTYFHNNKESFDNQKLPDGHALRFSQKLRRQHRALQIRRLSGIAAAIAVLAVTALIFNHQQTDAGQWNFCEANVSSKIPRDIQLADTYFKREMYEHSLQVFSAIASTNPDGKRKYLQSLSNYRQHRCELYSRMEDNPENPRLHAALLQQYQMAIQQQSKLIQMLNP
ncbi:MAG: hypothetical protein R6V52_12270 [Bacteroidales bacterium]